MEKSKSEIVWCHLVANVVIVLFVAVIALMGVSLKKEGLAVSSNKEYNGTIYAGDKNSKNVSIMINVYWNDEQVAEILDILKEEGIKTTFFVGGSWVKEAPELFKRMVEEGHEIGNHGTNHKEHGKISYEKNLTEIQACHEIVKHVANVEMELFAPPGGSYSKNTTKAAEFFGYKTIMWTRDTIDWRDQNTELIYNRAVTNICGGDLILMHPTKCSVEALKKIIPYVKSKGLTLTTVSQTLGL